MTEQKPPFVTKPLLLIALSHMLTDLSQGALPILLPFLKNAFSLTYSQVGFIVLTQNFTSSVIQPIFGYITDRLSLPWLIPAGLLLSGLGMAATGFASSYHGLLLIVVVTGLGIAAFHPQGAKGVHVISEVRIRGQSMAIFSLSGNLGQACGSVFMMALLTLPGSITNTLYFGIPAVLLSLLVWLNLPLLLPPAPLHQPGGKKAAVKTPIPFAMIGILLVYIFLRTSISAGLTTFIPLYYADYLGGSHAYASYLLSAYLLSGVAGTYVGGVLGDKYGRKTVILGSMLLTLPLLILLKYAAGFWALPLVVAIGFVYIASFSSTIVLAQEMMPGYEALGASLTTGFSIGLGGVAVTLLGFVADHFGVPSVFTVISVIPVAAFACAFLLPGKLFRADNLAAGKN
ncbi:MAG TPA: MFS transporter [Selenomonadales bacterium]|nr:MFS transporter [Selenomonadales bacterium]